MPVPANQINPSSLVANKKEINNHPLPQGDDYREVGGRVIPGAITEGWGEGNKKARKGGYGFTLIEIIVLIVFISIALVGVLSAYLHAMRTSSDPMIAIRAVELGQAYLDEILAKRFDENSGQGGVPRCDSTDPGALACTLVAGTEGEATRADFDDVDDYHDPVDTAPTDINGIALANYAGYLVAITVAYAGADVVLAANSAKRITVTVTSPKGHTFNFDAYRVNF